MLNEIFIAIICSLFFYLLGCIPTSYLLGKNLFKIDILNKDSRHSGLSNIYNLISKKYILLILFIDVIIKGFLPTLFIQLYDSKLLFIVIFLLIGHNWSVFINLRGGKGITVAIGIILGISYMLFVYLLSLFILFWIINRFRDSSFPWIISFFSLTFILNMNFLGDDYKSYGLILLLLCFLILIRRSLGITNYNKINYKIIINRILFDRENS
ncbi:uncharacterized protein METZ01_LOCUS199787 [marine metagenome]|uniref:Uncharacterized protein n=1 Tax=marine metagenome TaxID=408172 RepID=A0A382EAD3_9ZZZZ|tara:strand:- start:1026 stop:1661 length:636 start_codon:yes stop_codon:yes gene_type:complete